MNVFNIVKGMRDVFALAEFFVEGKNRKQSHVLLHISEPSLGEHTKGYFFAICELKNARLSDIQALQQLIDDIEKGYFQSNHLDAFEQTLQYMNNRSEEFLRDDLDIECFIGIIQGSKLTFSVHGEPVGHVLYQKSGTWKDVSLTQGAEPQHAELFSMVTQGNLSENDYLFIATSETQQVIPLDRVQKILSKMNVDQAAGTIEKQLQTMKSQLSFGGLFIYRPAPKHVPKTGKVPKHGGAGSKESMQQFASAQDETARTLSPPVIKGVTKGLKSLFSREKPKAPPKGTRVHTPKRSPQQKEDLLIILGRAIFMGVVGLLMTVKKVLFAVWFAVKYLLLLITNYGNQRNHIIDQSKQKIHRIRLYIKNLPLLSKLLFLGAIILALIFLASVGLSQHKQTVAKEHAQLEATIAAVIDKKNAAEGSRIYNNNSKAFTLLREAVLMIDKLNDAPKKYTSKIAALKADVDTQLQSLRQVRLVAPTEITSLPEGTSISHLVRTGDTLLAYGSHSPAVFEVDALTNATSALSLQGADGLIASQVLEDGKVIFTNAAGSAGIYDPEAHAISISTIQIQEIVSITQYNGSLYVLTKNGLISKHGSVPNGFDKGFTWIKDGTSVDSPRGITIDGDIYILTADNVEKYRKGIQQEFASSGLDTQLDQPTDIWTANEHQNIYVLDPHNNRIVVVDKRGNLVEQLTAEHWTELNGMSVDLVRNRIYVVNGHMIEYIGL